MKRLLVCVVLVACGGDDASDDASDGMSPDAPVDAPASVDAMIDAMSGVAHLTAKEDVTEVPGTLVFHDTPFGTSSSITVTVTNDGTAPVGPLAFTHDAGPDNDAFAVSSNTCNAQTLDPTEACEAIMSFEPLRIDDAILDLSFAAPNFTMQTFHVRGPGIPPLSQVVQFTSSTASVGDVPAGSGAHINTFDLHNVGSAEVTVTAIEVKSYRHTITFDPHTTTCGNKLAAGASCSVTTTFHPATAGDISAQVLVTVIEGALPTTAEVLISGHVVN